MSHFPWHSLLFLWLYLSETLSLLFIATSHFSFFPFHVLLSRPSHPALNPPRILVLFLHFHVFAFYLSPNHPMPLIYWR